MANLKGLMDFHEIIESQETVKRDIFYLMSQTTTSDFIENMDYISTNIIVRMLERMRTRTIELIEERQRMLLLIDEVKKKLAEIEKDKTD